LSPPTPKEVSCFVPFVTRRVEAVNPDSVKDVPDATPMVGVISDGDVAKTTDPVPVDVAEMVIVPEDVIGEFETDMKDGTASPTAVTVPPLNPATGAQLIDEPFETRAVPKGPTAVKPVPPLPIGTVFKEIVLLLLKLNGVTAANAPRVVIPCPGMFVVL